MSHGESAKQALLIVGVLLLSANYAAAERRLFVRDLIKPTQSCRNTVQGRSIVTDDRGLLCKRDHLDYHSGCCSSGQQFDCNMCNMQDRCCTELEACVSCCLKPEHDAATLAKTAYKSPRHRESGVWGDPFDYCMGVCRTHARSTMHENAYVSARHHCFSQLRLPMVSAPLPLGALDGVTVVFSSAGDSCDTACAKAGSKTCSAQHLQLMNSCDRLREHVACEAGCEAATAPPGVTPSYVIASAPKQNRPAMCFFSAVGDGLSCSNTEQNQQRLCPCV